MILDTFDKIRSNYFNKFDNFSTADVACKKIEAFEQLHFKQGITESG